MKKYEMPFLKKAHRASIYHETRILESKVCGCFYCKRTFAPTAIIDWTDENSEKGKTAMCPNCGIDAVLGDEFPILEEAFLKAMHNYWF